MNGLGHGLEVIVNRKGASTFSGRNWSTKVAAKAALLS